MTNSHSPSGFNKGNYLHAGWCFVPTLHRLEACMILFEANKFCFGFYLSFFAVITQNFNLFHLYKILLRCTFPSPWESTSTNLLFQGSFKHRFTNKVMSFLKLLGSRCKNNEWLRHFCKTDIFINHRAKSRAIIYLFNSCTCVK